MSLVPYYSSDSENEDNDGSVKIEENVLHKTKESKIDFSIKRPLINEETVDLDKNQKFKKPKIKFFLPSYKNNDEDEDLNEDQNSNEEDKKSNFTSYKGSGLTSLLPPPKNQKKRSTTTSLIPDILRRKQNNPESEINQSEIKNDLNEHINSSQSLSYENTIQQKISNEIIQISEKDSTTDYQKSLKLKYEIEKNFGDDLKEDFEIQDVNIANQLNSNLDYLKTLSAEKDPEIVGPIPTSKAKRKHQITYLAFQAKQNEVKLKDSWAKQRSNKAQANAKYGF